MSAQERPRTLNSSQGGNPSTGFKVEVTTEPLIDLGSIYRDKYSVQARPEGLHQLLWCRIEKMLVYLWVFTQTLCLLVGLTVLHFTTFSAIICYLVNGVARGRRELLPHRYPSSTS